MAIPPDQIIGFSEQPRAGNWTLRSALVRLAQPEPLRSEAILQIVRRLDAALKPFEKEPKKAGELTGVVETIGELSDALCEWAQAGPANPPLAAIDQTCAVLFAKLDELGVPLDRIRND